MGAGKCVLKSQHSVQRSRTPARSSVVTALPHVVPHRPHELEHTHAHARACVCVYGFVDLTCIEFTYFFLFLNHLRVSCRGDQYVFSKSEDILLHSDPNQEMRFGTILLSKSTDFNKSFTSRSRRIFFGN